MKKSGKQVGGKKQSRQGKKQQNNKEIQTNKVVPVFGSIDSENEATATSLGDRFVSDGGELRVLNVLVNVVRFRHGEV